MNSLDTVVLQMFNAGARQSWTFDVLVALVAHTELVKGGILMALVWWLWFSPHRTLPSEELRQRIVVTFAGASLAVAAASGLALILPYRLRPLHDPAAGFVVPYGESARAALGWSSFPSDHAALFFALATGLFMVSARLGWLVFAYVILVIVSPRIYLGLHYPTDVVAGALVGVAAVLTANISVVRRAVARPAVSYASRHPPAFYALFFLWTYQVAVLFEDVRFAGRVVAEVARAILQRHLSGS